MVVLGGGAFSYGQGTPVTVNAKRSSRQGGAHPQAAPRPHQTCDSRFCTAALTVELIPTLGALLPRGGPVQDPDLTLTPL